MKRDPFRYATIVVLGTDISLIEAIEASGIKCER